MVKRIFVYGFLIYVTIWMATPRNYFDGGYENYRSHLRDTAWYIDAWLYKNKSLRVNEVQKMLPEDQLIEMFGKPRFLDDKNVEIRTFWIGGAVICHAAGIDGEFATSDDMASLSSSAVYPLNTDWSFAESKRAEICLNICEKYSIEARSSEHDKIVELGVYDLTNDEREALSGLRIERRKGEIQVVFKNGAFYRRSYAGVMTVPTMHPFMKTFLFPQLDS